MTPTHLNPDIPSFDSLFDLEEIQEIQDSFAAATGVASIITDVEGLPITKPSNFCRLCMDIIRKTEKGLFNCMQSDRIIGRYHEQGPVIQPCLSGGLWDAGVSIHVGGKHIANWLVGQVRTPEMDMEVMKEYAHTIGSNRDAFAEALEEVKAMPLDQFKNIAKTLFLIANQLSDQAFQRTMKNRMIADLARKNEYLAALHDTSLGMFTRLDLTRVLDSIILRASNLTGIPNGFIYLYDPSCRDLEMKAACGKFTGLTGVRVKPGEGLSGKVWETGESLLIEDCQAWDEKSDNPEFGFVTSAISVPLTSGSKIEGTLGLGNHDPGIPVIPETLSILEQFAELATIAIDNARLFEGMKEELEKRIKLEETQRQMESRLRQSQKMESVGTLAGGIAHDFNNILFPIIGFSEMVLEDLPKDSPLRESMKSVLSGAFRARDLVQQILMFSRETEQEVHPLKIQLILKEVLKLAKATLPSTIKIMSHIPDNIGLVMADPTQIHQVAMNLMTNALHAMEETGGELRVDLSEMELENEGVHDLGIEPGSYVCLKIADTGSGMDEKTRKRIFEPYFTTKVRGKGTGLGLAVVHGIVKKLGGEIGVKTGMGRGSEFSIYLPRIMPRGEDAEVKAVAAIPASRNEHILVVDDEDAVLNMLDRSLSRMGCRVTCQNSSVKALELVKSDPKRFDLVITDLTMPDLTGDKLISGIKKIRPEIPVILCSGFNETILNQKATGTKPDKILMKPVTKNELAEALVMLLGS
ncbi:MAG: PocR ligand-binding domain-containing protein [Desulfobacula sp.]|nr:PocR ligand-binding domain-containing protein [Desulfobacula sp.]